jgi:5-methylcytosine-specific restriction endonuclease McrA
MAAIEEKKLKSWLLKHLRRVSKYWPEKTKVYHRVKVDRGQYRCEYCNSIFKQHELQIDHINPVVDVNKGFQGWDIYVSRLFCDSDKLQALCKPCHLIKTQAENEKRREVKKKSKKKH